MPKPEPFPVRDRDVSHVVIEIFGGDNNLSPYVLEDLQEMGAGNTGNFATLALADYEDAPAQVIELSPKTGHRVIGSLGEVDTGDPETLADFISRALVTYPEAAHKALGFWDHGTGVFGEHDPHEVLLDRGLRSVSRRSRSRSRPARRLFVSRAKLAAQPRLRAMLHDDTSGGVLTNYEAYGVLKAAFARSQQQAKLDIIFSDTCLNGMIEVAEQFKEFAQVVVGSEDLEPGDGWDYKELFQAMSAKPPKDGVEWGRQAVEAFERGYQHRADQHPCTLGAFRSTNGIPEAFSKLIRILLPAGKKGFAWIQEARAYTQAFARRDTYDIRDFATQLHEVAEAADAKAACDGVVAAFDAACVHSTALGDTVSNAHGLAFWLPSNRHTFREVAGTYSKLAFDQAAAWTAYLGKQFGD
ncbi:MAG TPA: clostripain-related cysteine peptidase [Vicinamibacteria bacterium]|nr:clostripain-related cysteine peptidase [Vicinamibacteria bacterium]